MKSSNQKGFTIVELVVVILLLGILTATALPRFMDVTDQAHTAVVDGVEGGLSTGIALFYAQWTATGKPTANVTNFGDGTLDPDTASGYPVAVDGTFNDQADCLAVYNGLLQAGGRPTAAAAAFSATAATLETNIEAAATATTDFVVTGNLAASPTGCNFYYVGQYKSGNVATPRSIPYITYVATPAASVSIGRATLTLNQN